MARVGRIAAASNRAASQELASSGEASRRSSTAQVQAMYPSINTLKSEDDDDGDFSCTECCKSAANTIYNYTLNSCRYTTCPGKKRRPLESTSSIEDMEVREIKDRLNFHFMNPFQKWKYERKRRFPWKLLVQLLSIFLVTLQLVLFAKTKFALTDFLQDNRRTFANLFINNVPNLDPDDSQTPSPIITLYTTDDLVAQINYTVNRYFQIKTLAVGSYGYGWDTVPGGRTRAMYPAVNLEVTRLENGVIDPAGKVYDVPTETLVTDQYQIFNTSVPDYSLLTYVDLPNILKNLSLIQKMDLQFNVSSVYVDTNGEAQCYQFVIKIGIVNDVRSGSMPVNIEVDSQRTECKNGSTILDIDTGVLTSTWLAILDGMVIFISILSMIQCVRSLINSARLTRFVREFFLTKFEYRLKVRHVLPLFNLWFVVVIISNALVIIGSIMKLLVAYGKIHSFELVDITSIILGLSVFGQWMGLLRFLSYFDKYNMLLLTLRLSMPSVLRFIVCAGILYIAFLLCGWLVFGPYHPKFRNPSITSECLFSLVNGDDMFATYHEMSQASTSAWVFSKIYLYVFIALFIYVVLSVFISLISDTYETLHEHWRNRSKGLLRDFATGELGRVKSQRSRNNSQSSFHSIIDDEDYDMIRGGWGNHHMTPTYIHMHTHTDKASTPLYGGTDSPFVVNGGPMLSTSPSESSPLISGGGVRWHMSSTPADSPNLKPKSTSMLLHSHT